MFVVPIVLLAFAAGGCEEALKPVAVALQGHEFAKANAMLDAIRPQCTASSAFHEIAGFAFELNGSFAGAAQEFQQAFSLDPQRSNNPSVILGYVQALVETNQSARWESFLAAKQRSLSPPVLFSLGTLFAKHRDYALAIRYFQQIPAALADDAVYFDLGLAHSRLRQFEEARKCYFHAIDIHPGHVEAYFRVGLDYAASGNLRKALPWLFRARDFAPARPDIAYALIEQLLSLKYLDTAAKAAAETLTANPRDPLLMVADADVLLAQGSTNAAAANYQNALSEEPKLPGALLGLARVEQVRGNAAEARKKLLDALSIDPENAAVCSELGSIEVHDGDWANAYSHLSKAWSLDESRLTVALQLAQALQHLERASDALHVLQPLAPALRDSSAFHSELAQIYTQLGRTAEAHTELGQVTALQEKSANALRFEDPKTYVH